MGEESVVGTVFGLQETCRAVRNGKKIGFRGLKSQQTYETSHDARTPKALNRAAEQCRERDHDHESKSGRRDTIVVAAPGLRRQIRGAMTQTRASHQRGGGRERLMRRRSTRQLRARSPSPSGSGSYGVDGWAVRIGRSDQVAS